MFSSKVAVPFLAAVLLLASSAAAEENVVTISGQESFDKVVGDASFVVVEFYAPWCGHCKKLAPEYEKAATALKKEGSEIVLAKVDATEDNNKDVASKFGVRGYPTLKIFRGGKTDKPSEYEGPREADGIVKYVKKISGPASVLLSTAAEVSSFKESEDVPVFAFFSAAEGEDFESYMSIADGLRNDYSFAHVTDAALIKDDCPSCAAGSIVAVNKLENKAEVFTGELDEDDVDDFLEGATKPVIITFGDAPLMRKALSGAFAQGAPAKVVGMTKSDGMDQAMFDAILAQTKENSDLTFMYADKTMDLFDRVKSHFGVEDEQLPAFIINSDEGKWHLFNADIAGLPKFIADWKDGKVEKTVKSAAVPDEPYEDDVRVVVAKEFDDILFGGKDVLIEFYAPWCGHCKSLAPTYAEVGALFKGNDKIEIAKMDATANDVPSAKFDVKGFPTIYFVQGEGEVLKYDGARTKDGFVEYIKKNAKASAGTHEEL